jgi:hypothetical protein
MPNIVSISPTSPINICITPDEGNSLLSFCHVVSFVCFEVDGVGGLAPGVDTFDAAAEAVAEDAAVGATVVVVFEAEPAFAAAMILEYPLVQQQWKG